MALSQQKFREIVFQLLYSHEISSPDESLMLELMMAELAVSKKNVRLALERVEKIQLHLTEIDSLITSFSTSYDFNRIQIVTKNILRLAVYELLYDDEIPHKVAIAEAIRLSRKFNTAESASFVNAVLDQLYKKSLGCEIDSNQLRLQSQAFLESEKAASEAAQAKSHQIKELNEQV